MRLFCHLSLLIASDIPQLPLSLIHIFRRPLPRNHAVRQRLGQPLHPARRPTQGLKQLAPSNPRQHLRPRVLGVQLLQFTQDFLRPLILHLRHHNLCLLYTSTTCACTAFWNRFSALMVLAIASGEISPVSKTLSPSRVTSRSSCSIFRWCCCTAAIASRHEFDPISMACLLYTSTPAPA